MNGLVHKIRERLDELHEEIERELEERRQKFRYRLEQRRVVFEREVQQAHKKLKMGLARFFRESKIGAIVTAPVIYSLIVPFALLDLFVTVYQFICFPVYGIPKVKRHEYVVMDRKYLAYLNLIEKLNCIYCEYGNGVIAYVREVASRTEHYWCPIKHARKVKGVPERYFEYLEYGDGEDFHGKLREQREKCRACESGCGKS